MTNTNSPTDETVTVRLVGGHPQWDGETLTYPRAEIYGPDLDDLGALLMIPDGSYPDHLSMDEGIDWRAHYAPADDADRTVWKFYGWVPS
jgi:hypothetical protein